MAEQAVPPSLSALTRESSRSSHSDVSARWLRQTGSKRAHSPRPRRPSRRQHAASPRAPVKRPRTDSEDAVQRACVAHCTRSRSSTDNQQTLLIQKNTNSTFDVAASTLNSQRFSKNEASKTDGNGALFPLDERDFAYSPFSSSTVTTELVDSDYSVYTPTSSKRSNKRKKLSSTKKRRSGRATQKDKKEEKIEGATGRQGRSPSSGREEVRHRRSLIPRLVNCAYPLRNRSRTDPGVPSTSKARDTSASSSTSEASSKRPISCLRQLSSRVRKSGTPTPKTEASTSSDKSSHSRETPKSNKLVIVPQELPYLRQTNARRSIAAANNNLGAGVTRGRGAGGRQSPSQAKRDSSGASSIPGPSTASSGAKWKARKDMPQPGQQPANTNTKRDKKGKSSLGSCASSGGGGREGARRQTGAVHHQPNPGTATSAIASTSSNNQQSLAPNMAGGHSAEKETKSKGKGSSQASPAATVQPSLEESYLADMASASVAGAAPALAGESSSEEGEVGRLQALLEARGLPPHLLGALGPRMQHLLHRTMGASTAATKAAQLLAGLQATGDEGQQLQAVIEMCQLLVMGNEDTLAGFPVRQVVPALINLLAMEHNFDMMNHACRALTYMMEALPRTSGAVALAVPAFLDKLQAITCMDVAEQSLTALDMLSRRHSKSILQARGVAACLMYLDFFSINAQRAALSITSNCCQNLSSEEFHYVRDSLQLLANRLTQQDKKSVESVCLAFSRLVDSYQQDPARLQEIATPELLTNLQQLLVVSPPVISTGTFITVLRMLSVMCASCPQLAVALHRRNIADTLLYLLTGSTVPTALAEHVELVSRSPQELYEITCLIGELMPRLPVDGMFAVDVYLERPWGGAEQPDMPVQWQWRDDRGVWRAYTAADSRIIEAAHAASEDEVALTAMGRAYTVDLHSMQQINEDTGTARPVQRRQQTPTQDTQAVQGALDARVSCVRGEQALAVPFVRALLAVLHEVYSSSAGPAVRCQCLKALLRMIYYADTELLREVLKNQIISSHIAGMMASNDLRIVVGSLQLAEILMQKLPEEFGVHFRREGVMHQVAQLADPGVPLGASPPKQAPPTPRREHHGSPLLAMANSARKSKSGGVTVSTVRSASSLMRAAAAAAAASSSSSPGASLLGASIPGASTSGVPPAHPNSAPPNLGTSSAGSMSMESLFSSASSASLTIDTASMVAIPVSVSRHSDIPLNHRSQSPVALHFADMLRRKRVPKRQGGCVSGGAGAGVGVGAVTGGRAARRAQRQEDASPASARPSPQATHHHHTQGSTSRSRLGAATSKTSAFLSSLNPSRWGRGLAHATGPGYIPTPTHTPHKDSAAWLLAKSQSNANIAAHNREKVRTWVREQSAVFASVYAGGSSASSAAGAHPALDTLARLAATLRCHATQPRGEQAAALVRLRATLVDTDVSPFEINHSGLIGALLHYLTHVGADTDNEDTLTEIPAEELDARDNRLRLFLNIFAEMPLSPDELEPMFMFGRGALGVLVSKVGACVSHLEQFPVRVHDLPARPATSALKFFNTHQLMCDLKRHPNCTNLKQWKGGVVRIDPLALVQAIERYLALRGYAIPRGTKDSSGGSQGSASASAGSNLGPDTDDDQNSDDDIDDTLAAVVISQGDRQEHKLEFLVGDTVLPYNMTVYQAIRQHGAQASDQSETDTDTEAPLGNASIWVQTHTIYYRSVEAEESGGRVSGGSGGAHTAQHARKGKGSSTKANRRKTGQDDLWNEGVVPARSSALNKLLSSRLPTSVSVCDASLPALCLLRALHALCRHWPALYGDAACHQMAAPLLPNQDFVNTKLAAKASRQLQDPLVIMTGNLPQWLQQIAYACPFVLPFETRHLLFYAVSFDRDRALQRLLEAGGGAGLGAGGGGSAGAGGGGAGGHDATERVAPRLDRRKRAVHRHNILRQAEQLMHEFAHSKALLEVQYENEVGTGLGPTLEFYALVSQELQRADLDLWHGSENFKQKPSSFAGEIVKSDPLVVSDRPGTSPDAAHLASHVYNDLSLTDEQNRNNVNEQLFASFDMPMIVDSADVNLNEVQGRHTIEKMSLGGSLSYVSWPCGLFPQALGRNSKASQQSRVKAKFRFLGKFMAKAVMDSRMMDIPLSTTFYRWMVGEERSLWLADVRHVAPELWRSLCRLQQVAGQAQRIERDTHLTPHQRNQMLESLELDGCPIEELGLDFILPGRGCTELKRGGRDTPVTAHNLRHYISLVVHWMLAEGVQRQMDAFKEGFESVFALKNLQIFYPEELELVFCGSPSGGPSLQQKWDVKTLSECCRADHGFTSESRVIRQLYEVLASYCREEQRLFLQFVTGSPRLPTGGFKALSPPLTIVRKTLEPNVNPDDYLPSVMTCVNYLKLPDYTSADVMRRKLRVAASEGQHCFHLS